MMSCDCLAHNKSHLLKKLINGLKIPNLFNNI